MGTEYGDQLIDMYKGAYGDEKDGSAELRILNNKLIGKKS